MTDKATIEITAPVSGTLVSVAGEPGDVIKVGAELAVFATDGEQPSRHDEQTDSSFRRKPETSANNGTPGWQGHSVLLDCRVKPGMTGKEAIHLNPLQAARQTVNVSSHPPPGQGK